MTIIEVYKAIGKFPFPRFRRLNWRDGWVLSGNETTMWITGPGHQTCDTQSSYVPTREDVVAEDWEICK